MLRSAWAVKARVFYKINPSLRLFRFLSFFVFCLLFRVSFFSPFFCTCNVSYSTSLTILSFPRESLSTTLLERDENVSSSRFWNIFNGIICFTCVSLYFFNIFVSEKALNRIAFVPHYVALYRLLYLKICWKSEIWTWNFIGEETNVSHQVDILDTKVVDGISRVAGQYVERLVFGEFVEIDRNLHDTKGYLSISAHHCESFINI